MWRRRSLLTLCVVLLLASGAFLASAAAKDGKKDVSGKDKKKANKIAFVVDGQRWTVHKNSEGRAFFYNGETGKTQWTDPREKPMTVNQRTLIVVFFTVPLVLMIGGAAGYLYWIRKTRPDLLKGPKKVKGLKNWERALLPPKVAKPKDRARSASPPPEDAKKSE